MKVEFIETKRFSNTTVLYSMVVDNVIKKRNILRNIHHNIDQRGIALYSLKTNTFELEAPDKDSVLKNYEFIKALFANDGSFREKFPHSTEDWDYILNPQ